MDERIQPKPAGPRGAGHVLMHRDELRSILSSLSHELCRPLLSLRAGFDLLLERPAVTVPGRREDHVHAMIDVCDDLLRLTHSYLDFASMVQGTRPICWGTYSLGALFGEIESQFEPMAAARGISWKVLLEDPAAEVLTDASKCQQILGNLASNAIKYTKSGGSVEVHGQLDRDSWSVSMVDSGEGIPADAIAKVFEPFYRLPRDENEGVEGNGLGLPICRELVEQLQGEISLESILGKGTTARVRFPLGPGPSPKSAGSAVKPSKGRSKGTSQAIPGNPVYLQ